MTGKPIDAIKRFAFFAYSGAAFLALCLPLFIVFGTVEIIKGGQKLFGLPVFLLVPALLPICMILTIMLGIIPIIFAGIIFEIIFQMFKKVPITTVPLASALCGLAFAFQDNFLSNNLPDLDLTGDPTPAQTMRFDSLVTVPFLLAFLVVWWAGRWGQKSESSPRPVM